MKYRELEKKYCLIKTDSKNIAVSDVEFLTHESGKNLFSILKVSTIILLKCYMYVTDREK